MKKKRYISCTVQDDGNGAIVELSGNSKELTAMVCTIVYNVAATLETDTGKFCAAISEITVNIAKDIEENKKEESGNEDYVF